jgi:3-isopropylmalate/(R)-2-methylmalate dehydratase small subunit
MEAIRTISSRAVAIPAENIDTDQIIPARYLKVTDKVGLGEGLFADWRYDAAGAPKPDFVLNDPKARGARILVGGHNFGCGSSREHAPWALLGYGFQAVLSTYFADIFQNNALKNGLVPVQLERETHRRVLELVQSEPDTELTIDVEAQTLALPDGTVAHFPLEAFAKHCLLQGVDQLGFLLAEEPAIAAYEARNEGWIDTTTDEPEAAWTR